MASAISVGLVALCLAFIFKGLPAMARYVAFAVPAGIEGQIGWASQKALTKYITTGQTTDDQAVLARVGEQLAALSKAAHTHLVVTPVAVNLAFPNAFALPGGTVIVTTGLLRLGLTDDEIAAVMAHELGHEELEARPPEHPPSELRVDRGQRGHRGPRNPVQLLGQPSDLPPHPTVGIRGISRGKRTRMPSTS